MNHRNQSQIIHLVWRIPQVHMTHQTSSALPSYLQLSLTTEFYPITGLCWCLHWLIFVLCVCCQHQNIHFSTLWNLCLWKCTVKLLCMCAGEQFCVASVEAISEDAVFRDKLKHMGKCKSFVSPKPFFSRFTLMFSVFVLLYHLALFNLELADTHPDIIL